MLEFLKGLFMETDPQMKTLSRGRHAEAEIMGEKFLTFLAFGGTMRYMWGPSGEIIDLTDSQFEEVKVWSRQGHSLTEIRKRAKQYFVKKAAA